MAVAKNLTPPAIPQIDYPVVQRPALGGEMDVFITAKPSRVLGIATVVEEGTGIASVTVSSGGTGFTTGDVVTFTGTGSGASGRIIAAAGVITSIIITDTGAGYTGTPTVVESSAGTGATLVAVLGTAIDYQFINTPNASNTGPIIAVVKNELRADAAAVVTYAGLAGTFQATEWARIQNSFNFPTGKAVEMFTVGTYTAPLSSDVPIITNAKRGSTIVLLEMPFITDYSHVGCTNSKKIKFPVRSSKAIACQLESARWTVPGKTEVGTLEVVGLSENPDDGLQRFAGLKSSAMLKTRAESKIETSRTFVTDWTPALDQDSPESDNEATQTASGLFSLVAVLVAPGTP